MASLGSITAHVLVALGDGEPHEVATFDIPITVSGPIRDDPGVSAYLRLTPRTPLVLADALREIAKHLEGGK